MAAGNQNSPRGRVPGDAGVKQSAPEETLRTETITIERKTFVFILKENPRGRFMRITEEAGGRRDTIIIPSTGLEDFRRVVEEMTRAAAEPAGQSQQP